MDYQNDKLGELYGSEYPEIDQASRKKLKLTEAVAGSFQKKLRILAEAIEELNFDIQDRAEISWGVKAEIETEISGLEFQLKELKRWTLGAVDSVEARRLGLERELFDLRQQKRGEEIKEWSDISSLKRKRRELIMEYQSLMKTREAIGK